jgi:hypothetical protein
MPRKLDIEIIACFGKNSPNPDKLDRNEFGPKSFKYIIHRLPKELQSRLKIFRSFNTPSLRCIMLFDNHGPRYGFIGWYTYSNCNRHIVGRNNVQIFVDRTTDIGLALLRFTEETYNKICKENEVECLWPNLN